MSSAMLHFLTSLSSVHSDRIDYLYFGATALLDDSELGCREEMA